MIHILIDKQEKLPYTFDKSHFRESKADLETGDYIVYDYPKGIVIERKSLDDFVKSIQEDRFFKEIDRLKEFENPAIIVEGSLCQIKNHKYNNPIFPTRVIDLSTDILIQHKIPIIFCEDRQHAIYFTQNMIIKYVKTKTCTKVQEAPKKKRVIKQCPDDII
jgi:ERCC4-type nuclease